MANLMKASLAISIPNHLSTYISKLTPHLPYPNNTSSIAFSTAICQLGSSWNGLRYASITVSKQFVSKVADKRRKCRGNVVYASLFGVGAPEALVIGVVALLVFGPKGLAEVARNLGKTLRAFQPTIRELQDVSREFKSTLEREIGLDDIANPVQNTYTPTTRTPTVSPTPASNSNAVEETPIEFNGSPSPSQAYTSKEYLKVTDEQLKASAAAAWQHEQVSSTFEEQRVSQRTQSESTVQESILPESPPSPAKLDGEAS